MCHICPTHYSLYNHSTLPHLIFTSSLWSRRRKTFYPHLRLHCQQVVKQDTNSRSRELSLLTPATPHPNPHPPPLHPHSHPITSSNKIFFLCTYCQTLQFLENMTWTLSDSEFLQTYWYLFFNISRIEGPGKNLKSIIAEGRINFKLFFPVSKLW